MVDRPVDVVGWYGVRIFGCCVGSVFGGGTVIVAVTMSHDGSNKYDPSLRFISVVLVLTKKTNVEWDGDWMISNHVRDRNESTLYQILLQKMNHLLHSNLCLCMP